MHLVFLLEEQSAKNVLDILLPKILPKTVTFTIVAHRGKTDLCRSIPKKLKAWQPRPDHFIILHDQDKNDCIQLKQSLLEICQGYSNVLIRIVCYELESWYFGDLPALGRVFTGFAISRIQNKDRYRVPDAIVKPSDKLEKLIPEFRKGKASKEIPKQMDIEKNNSQSFRAFINGIRGILSPC